IEGRTEAKRRWRPGKLGDLPYVQATHSLNPLYINEINEIHQFQGNIELGSLLIKSSIELVELAVDQRVDQRVDYVELFGSLCGLLQTGTLSLASTLTISTPPIKSNRDFLPCAVCGELIPEITKQRQYMTSSASTGYEIGLARVSAIMSRPMTHAWRASIVNFLLRWPRRILETIEHGALGILSTLQLERSSGGKILTRLSEKPSPRRLSKLKSVSFDFGGNGEQWASCITSSEDRAAIDLELMQNNETRWNSTFMMIQRAIRKREQIDHFITYLDTKAAEPRQRVPVQDHLSQQDWLLLAEIQSLLKPLYEITMRCQGWAKEGRYGALWEVMIGMEYLLNFFEEQKLIFSPPDGTADELQIARASATTSTAFQFIFALLMSILLRLSQDVVLYELTKVADARNTCHSILETNIPVHSRKLRVLMMTTDDAYKSLSITVGQNLTSITVYLANRHFTRLPLFYTRAGTCL
ncbi:Uncharacterized protein HZ326_31851, partial [Fusarium oxysporum f. sp. albedinis]